MLLAVAELLGIFALLVVIQSNNVHLPDGAIALAIIALVLRIIGEYRERKKFVQVMMDYMAEIKKDMPIGHVNAVYEVLTAQKESNQRLEERFTETEKAIESVRSIDRNLVGFLQAIENMEKYMESGLVIHHTVLRSHNVLEKRFDEFEKFLRNLARRFHIRL